MSLRAVLIPLLAVCLNASAIPKGELMEWSLNLFEAAREANHDAVCETVDLLDPPGHSAGYYSIDGTQDGHIFYTYFENRHNDSNAPLVFWTNGGPGASSMRGLFLENGPYRLQSDGSLCWNVFGWDIGHNIVFVDQPLGTGYSYSTLGLDRVRTGEKVGEDIVNFFYAFFKAHPDLAEKDLFISGQSFAGHYLPTMADSILQANQRNRSMKINLKGVIIGTPWTSPITHYHSNPHYAEQNGLIDADTKAKMLDDWETCATGLTVCNTAAADSQKSICVDSLNFCEDHLFFVFFRLHPRLNVYDIRQQDCDNGGCYDLSYLIDFLNQPSIKQALRVEGFVEWEPSNKTVRHDLFWYAALDMVHVVKKLLNEGLPILVFVGDKDLICNCLGNENWLDKMQWKGAKKWKTAQKKTWISNGKEAGDIRHSGLLTFINVYEAGHYLPMDQPAVSLNMITTYTRRNKFMTKDRATSNPTLIT